MELDATFRVCDACVFKLTALVNHRQLERIFAAVAGWRVFYKNWRIAQYNKGLRTVIPKPYFPTSGSVWSLKRYEYNYPPEMKVVQDK